MRSIVGIGRGSLSGVPVEALAEAPRGRAQGELRVNAHPSRHVNQAEERLAEPDLGGVAKRRIAEALARRIRSLEAR
jgi:hypothetical protein